MVQHVLPVFTASEPYLRSIVRLSLSLFFLAGTEIHLITAQACEVVGTVVKNGMQWTNPEVIHFSPSE